MEDRYIMLEKIDRAKEAQADADLNLIITMVSKWSKKNPENKDLKELAEASTSLFFILNSYHTDRKMYHKAIAQYRTDKIRAIERARKAEDKLNNKI